VLIDFIYENDLVAIGRKSLLKKERETDSHLGNDIRLRKNETHMDVKRIKLGGLRLILNRGRIFDRNRSVYLVSKYSGKRRVSTQVFLFHPHKKKLFLLFLFLEMSFKTIKLYNLCPNNSRIKEMYIQLTLLKRFI